MVFPSAETSWPVSPVCHQNMLMRVEIMGWTVVFAGERGTGHVCVKLGTVHPHVPQGGFAIVPNVEVGSAVSGLAGPDREPTMEVTSALAAGGRGAPLEVAGGCDPILGSLAGRDEVGIHLKPYRCPNDFLIVSQVGSLEGVICADGYRPGCATSRVGLDCVWRVRKQIASCLPVAVTKHDRQFFNILVRFVAAPSLVWAQGDDLGESGRDADLWRDLPEREPR